MKSTISQGRRTRSAVENRLTRADPAIGRVIAAVIARVGLQRIVPSRALPFEALARAVVYQSISGKTGASIFASLKATVAPPLTPSKILALRPKSLTKVGLSSVKTRTIRELARWFISNPKLASALHRLPDDEVIEHLTAIRGIGTWTANVFLIFSLGRRDVMPAADLGIRRGLQLADDLRAIATQKRVLERSRAWSPYRSVASIYLWQAAKLRLRQNDLKQKVK
jgi:DNA-3-methyladenine glycosylase II